MVELTKYMRAIFGSVLHLEDYTSCDDFPMYLTDTYHFFAMRIGADPFILAKPKEKIRINITVLKKQLAKIQAIAVVSPVLVLENLRLSQRNALIQAGIAFIVPGKQLHIPRFTLSLSEAEEFAEECGDQFSVAAQVVFIHLLLNRVKATNAHQLSRQLNYSVSSINRALQELSSRKLVDASGSNTRKQYTITDHKILWDNGKKYLFNPVKTQYFVSPSAEHYDFPMSGDTALSHLSFLSGTGINYFATSSKDFQKIDKAHILNKYDMVDDNYTVIEVFRYDPRLLSSGDCVDVISLYAQFKDSRDERVQMEIEALTNNIFQKH